MHSGIPSRKPSVYHPWQQGRVWRWLGKIADFLLAIVLLAGIAGALWLAYVRLTQNAFFPMKRIIMERPLIYADKQDIVDVVRNYGRLDMLQINVKKLADKIAKLSWVQSVSIRKRWPDGLQISVGERIPILRWGQDEFLDSSAVHFSVPESPSLADLSRVYGPEGYEQTVMNMYKTLVPWFKQQGIKISELTLDPRLVWRVRLTDGVEFILGKDDLNARFKKLVVVNRRIVSQYEKYIQSIDLRYQNGFSVRWKSGVKLIDNATNEK